MALPSPGGFSVEREVFNVQYAYDRWIRQDDFTPRNEHQRRYLTSLQTPEDAVLPRAAPNAFPATDLGPPLPFTDPVSRSPETRAHSGALRSRQTSRSEDAADSDSSTIVPVPISVVMTSARKPPRSPTIIERQQQWPRLHGTTLLQAVIAVGAPAGPATPGSGSRRHGRRRLARACAR